MEVHKGSARMTSEQQDFSSAEMTPQTPPPSQVGTPGQGQSKSSRRRRRKRNKKPGAVAGAPQTGETGEGSAIPTVQASVEPGQSISNGNGAGGPTKRWKKKKFRSGGPGGGNPNPGNQINSNGNGGGGRQQRRGKQKGPRSFVGPMDHSYRDGIGNYADSPPSTIEIHGNHNGNGHGGHRSHTRHNGGAGDSQENFNLGTREIIPPVPENAATHIYCFIDDLFFLAKIQETARKLGVKVVFLKNDKESLATLSDAGETDHPALIVFDLNNANAKPLTLIPKLKTKFKRTTSIIGFLSHLQGDLKAKAVEAGCDTVMPRSAFSQNLPNLLRRYGIEEEEENNFNA
ncbi:MAG: response regulator [Acidobacteriaceae bacterium]|nr:response regulator [Acidobacteriaceae bacterium]